MQVWDLKRIAKNYLKEGGLIMDVICWFPTQVVARSIERIDSEYHFFEIILWVKCLRIFKGFFIFNVTKIRDQIQKQIMKNNQI